jgi:hypothetical protein
MASIRLLIVVFLHSGQLSALSGQLRKTEKGDRDREKKQRQRKETETKKETKTISVSISVSVFYG